MAFDPFLYVALGLGYLVGRFVRVPPGWLRRASLGTVAVLVGLLGGTLAGLPLGSLVEAIPVGLGVAGVTLGLTVVIALLLRQGSAPSRFPVGPRSELARYGTSVGLLVALGIGFVAGRLTGATFGVAIPWALYVLLGIVGLDITITLSSVRRAWLPIVASAAGGIAAAGVLVVAGIAAPVALATTLAFGWYTLAGPLVAARAGAALGFVAFVANFLRENLTMVSAPAAGRRLGAEGLAAMGGATSMDTTLYFVTRFGDPDAAGLALASGLVLTLAAGVLLPVLLAI